MKTSNLNITDSPNVSLACSSEHPGSIFFPVEHKTSIRMRYDQIISRVGFDCADGGASEELKNWEKRWKFYLAPLGTCRNSENELGSLTIEGSFPTKSGHRSSSAWFKDSESIDIIRTDPSSKPIWKRRCLWKNVGSFAPQLQIRLRISKSPAILYPPMCRSGRIFYWRAR